MNLSTLRTEFSDRGFNYLSTTRQDYFLNRALSEACDEDYDFLQSTAIGAAPLVISDLRTIESVVDQTSQVKLRPLDRREISDWDYDLTVTGSPWAYYLSNITTLDVYPFTADTLSVSYWKVPDALSADTDEPPMAERFHLGLVDGAAAYAYFDSDNFDAAVQMLTLFEQTKQRMRDQLLVQQADRPQEFILVEDCP